MESTGTIFFVANSATFFPEIMETYQERGELETGCLQKKFMSHGKNQGMEYKTLLKKTRRLPQHQECIARKSVIKWFRNMVTPKFSPSTAFDFKNQKPNKGTSYVHQVCWNFLLID